MTPVETAAPAVSADVSSAPSLGESIGEFFGDFTGGGESPEPETTSAEGTTPSEPAAGTEHDTTSEPVAADDGTDAPASEGTTPDAQAPTPEDDPFKDTTAATFVVNGQPQTNEDIRVFKEGGAVIRPEALPNVLSKLAEREQLSERVRTRDAEYQTLSKVNEWTGEDNRTVTGPQAAVERIVAHAAVLSENQLLVDTLMDPERLYAILTTEQVPDGNGGMRERVIISPAALASLQTQNELRQLKSAQALREHYKGVIAQHSKAAPAPVNYTAEAPNLVAEVARLANLDASVLTAEDRQTLAEQLPFHVKDGNASVAWQNLAKRMMSGRAKERASTQKIVSVTTDATKKGLANMAAAARGMRQTPKAPAAPPKPVSPTQERADNEGDLYDLQQRAASRALRGASA